MPWKRGCVREQIWSHHPVTLSPRLLRWLPLPLGDHHHCQKSHHSWTRIASWKTRMKSLLTTTRLNGRRTKINYIWAYIWLIESRFWCQTYSSCLNRSTTLSTPLEVSRPLSGIATQISRSVIHNHGRRGSRSVPLARRQPLELKRENYTTGQGERMDIDLLNSSSALSKYHSPNTEANRSSVRAPAHPYSRSLPRFKLHGLPLASPFREKHFILPPSPPQK